MKMKKIRITALILIVSMLAFIFAGCAKKDETKPQMTLNVVTTIADYAMDLNITFFEQYDHVILGSAELPLYYFQLKEIDFSFSVGVDEDGMIESMLLSHISGAEIYLFHKDPGKLDPNAAPYEKPADSIMIQQFIDKMTEN